MKNYFKKFSKIAICAMLALFMALSPTGIAHAEPVVLEIGNEARHVNINDVDASSARTLDDYIADFIARYNWSTAPNENATGWTINADSPDSEHIALFGVNENGITRRALPSFDDVFGIGLASLEVAISAAFDEPLSIEDVANLNFDEHLPHIQLLILRARYEVVFSDDVSWTVDGQMAVTNSNGEIEKLPEFSELFPGWDLALIESIVGERTHSNVYYTVDNVQALFQHFFRAQGTIHRQQANVMAPVFVTFANNAFRLVHVDVILFQMNWPIGGVNIGITNMQNGQSVGWVGNLRPGQGITLVNMPHGAVRGVRASTVDNSGFVVIDGFVR